MLGSMKSPPAWKWSAFGKHPVAGDYVKIGPNDPFFQAFSGWVENGWHRVSVERNNTQSLYSWRFWAKGYQRDSLICGLGRDSFDTIGRPYHLVIMGAGDLPGWQRRLGLLPFALEKTWVRMEYLATKRYMDYAQLETDICRVPAPDADWPEREAEQRHRWATWHSTTNTGGERETITPAAPPDEPEFLTTLGADACRDVIMAAGFQHASMQEPGGGIPNAVFLGGLPTATYLAVFRRPLIVPDFIRLWSVGRRISS